MNELQFRGKLQNQTFLLSILGLENTLCVAHVLFPESPSCNPDSQSPSPSNIFLDSSFSSCESVSNIFSSFKDQPLFCPLFKNYKAPFNKTLVLRDFNKNGNLRDVLACNDEIEELYLASILKSVLHALSKVHSLGFCRLQIEPKHIEINDDGDLVFPFYYSVRSASVAGLVRDLTALKSLVKSLIDKPNFGFKDIDKTKYSNRFKDFLKSLFENYGFEGFIQSNGSENHDLFAKRYTRGNRQQRPESIGRTEKPLRRLGQAQIHAQASVARASHRHRQRLASLDQSATAEVLSKCT